MGRGRERTVEVVGEGRRCVEVSVEKAGRLERFYAIGG